MNRWLVALGYKSTIKNTCEFLHCWGPRTDPCGKPHFFFFFFTIIDSLFRWCHQWPHYLQHKPDGLPRQARLAALYTADHPQWRRPIWFPNWPACGQAHHHRGRSKQKHPAWTEKKGRVYVSNGGDVYRPSPISPWGPKIKCIFFLLICLRSSGPIGQGDEGDLFFLRTLLQINEGTVLI